MSLDLKAHGYSFVCAQKFDTFFWIFCAERTVHSYIVLHIYVHARQMFLNLHVIAFMSTYSNILSLCIVCSS